VACLVEQVVHPLAVHPFLALEVQAVRHQEVRKHQQLVQCPILALEVLVVRHQEVLKHQPLVQYPSLALEA